MDDFIFLGKTLECIYSLEWVVQHEETNYATNLEKLGVLQKVQILFRRGFPKQELETPADYFPFGIGGNTKKGTTDALTIAMRLHPNTWFKDRELLFEKGQ